ncbi:unnamed protein product [Choristocarpus tenellus]
MSALSSDLMLEFLSFGTHTDLCHLQSVSRDLNEAAGKENLWKSLVAAEGLLGRDEIAPAISALGLSSHKQLVEVLTRIGIPSGVIGYWKADFRRHGNWSGSDLNDDYGFSAKGELLRISVTEGGILGESILPQGSTRGVFRVKVSLSPTGSNGKLGVILFPLEDEFSMGGRSNPPGVEPLISGSGSPTTSTSWGCDSSDVCSISIKRAGSGFFLSRGKTLGRYSKLEWADDYGVHARDINTGSFSFSMDSDLQRLCGLWSASHGFNGYEVLQIDFGTKGPRDFETSKTLASKSATIGPGYHIGKSKSGTTRALSSVPPTFTYPNLSGDKHEDGAARTGDWGHAMAGTGEEGQLSFLVGTKVTGDLHVPAGRFSFAVDLARFYSPLEELKRDQRPMALLTPGGPVKEDFTMRAAYIKRWYKGCGQINHVPGEWWPELMDIDFIIYHEKSMLVTFSVVWNSPQFSLRMALDFHTLKGRMGQLPTWNA